MPITVPGVGPTGPDTEPRIDSGSPSSVGRRSFLSLATGTAALGAGVAGYRWIRRRPEPTYYSQAVGLGPAGQRVPIPPGARSEFFAGSRVLMPTTAGSAPGARRVLAAEQAWLRSGSVPGRDGHWAAMAHYALLDLKVMLLGNGALVAGWTPHWRYVWPRDASAAAVAFAASGHIDDARAVLTFVQNQQAVDGRFQARYLADGSGVPDHRGIQLDGTGWVLWAVQQVLARVPTAQGRALVEELRPMIDRSTQAILIAIDNPRGLPPVSSDYWEVKEDELTLGTVGPLLAGLAAAGPLYLAAGEPGRAGQARVAAEKLGATVVREFGPGYPRHLGGDDPDAAVTFLSPPIGPLTSADVFAAQLSVPAGMMRAAGGVAPGSSWKDDGVSWTPENAMFALAAAGRGDRATAEHYLNWLDAHRTAYGALPEKVRRDGAPAGPAPLALTAALVLLTLDTLG